MIVWYNIIKIQIRMNKEEAKDRLIEVLTNQVVDLTMMSKIELGDDVIQEIKRLKDIIYPNNIEGPIGFN